MNVMRTPKTIDLAITNKCNLRCLYCYHFGGACEVKADLPKAEWLRFFEELNRCAIMEVCIAGGEPLVRKDLPEIIESVVRNRMRYSLLTNGTLITDKLAVFLAETRRCNSVQVSIDGSTPDVHDSCRGKGNFVRAVEGARRLIDHGIGTTVRVTIHKNNVADLENIARLLLEDLKLPSFSTNCASHMGLCRQNREIVQLDVADRIRAMDTLVRLGRKYPGRISSSAGPQAEARQWGEIENAREAGKPHLPGCGYLASCNGPRDRMAVRADGVMVPCVQLSHIELGRINRDSLQDVWQRHPEMQRLRERNRIPLSNFAFCRDCEYIPYCRGGCPAIAYTMAGRDDHPSPDACLREFLRAGGKLPRMERPIAVATTGSHIAHG